MDQDNELFDIRNLSYSSPTLIISFTCVFFYVFYLLFNLYLSYIGDNSFTFYLTNNIDSVSASINSYDISSLFLSIFMHGSPVHLLVNMVVLVSFGLLLEKYLSNLMYYVFFLSCGFVAVVIQLVALSISGIEIEVVGASGAIAGVIGFLTVVNPKFKIYLFFVFPMNILTGVIIFLSLSFVVVYFHGFGAYRVAHTAHISGLLFGMAFSFFFVRFKSKENNNNNMEKSRSRKIWESELLGDKWEEPSDESGEEGTFFKVFLEKADEDYSDSEVIKHKLIFDNNTDCELLLGIPPMLDEEKHIANLVGENEDKIEVHIKIKDDEDLIIQPRSEKTFTFKTKKEKIDEIFENSDEITYDIKMDKFEGFNGHYKITESDFESMMSADILRKF